MSAQPIPGPYTFDPDAGSIESADGVIVATVSSVESFPCRDTEKDEEFEAELSAAGRVLAAAPDLLTQLVGAVALAEHIIASLDIDPETTTLRVRANGEDIADIPIATLIANQKAAIAKAEGRS